MSNYFDESRSKTSMATVIKKNLSLIEGSFKRRFLIYRVMLNVVHLDQRNKILK